MIGLKSILSHLLYPTALSLELLLLGLSMLVLTRRQRAGKILIGLGCLLLLLASFHPVANRLLGPLESRYPPLGHPPQGVKWIVVLGSWATCDTGMPAGSQLTGSGLSRLVEGVMLYRNCPGSKLLLSGGGSWRGGSGTATAEIARGLGAPENDILVLTGAVDTEHEADIARGFVQNEPLILVTSAAHMVRSVALFRAQGMDPIPAPVELLVGTADCGSPLWLIPSQLALAKTTAALHEYLGLAWLKLRGKS